MGETIFLTLIAANRHICLFLLNWEVRKPKTFLIFFQK